MRNSQFTPFFVAIVAAFLTAFLNAAPSGGPYGPIQQAFPLPEAKTLFYVAPDAPDNADGSSLESPTSIESAIARASTGDAIILRGGTYRTGGLRLSQGITIQPYQAERPVFKGTRIASNWTKIADRQFQTYWPNLFPAQPADWWRKERNVERTPLHRFNNDMVFIDGKLLLSVGSLEELSPNTYYIDYANATITLADDPTDKTVEITAFNSALVRTMRTAHGKPNDGIGPTLRGITFTQYARLALEIEGVEPGEYTSPENFGKEVVGSTLEHLTISHCSRVAGYFRGDGLTIRNCLVSDCGTEGIYVINSADVLLERNIVTRTNSSEQLSGYYASSVKIFNQSYNVVCRDNLIIDNPHASGIWYDVGNVDGIVVDNWLQNTRDGFFFEISKGATAAGNVFVNCSPGSRVLNSSGVKLYQNTYYNSRADFIRTPRSHTAGDHFGWHASAGPDVEERHSHAFINNLLFADAAYDQEQTGPYSFGGPLVSFFQSPELADRLTQAQVDAIDGNIYVRQAGQGERPIIFFTPTLSDEAFIPINAPDELTALYPEFESNSVAFFEYFGPLFKGRELGNFQILPDFPGKSVGVALPEMVNELLHLQDSPSFPGAYQP